MRIREGVALDFDDVMFVPQRSSVDSRADANLIRTFRFCNSPRTLACLPVISANMDSTGSMEMAKVLSKHCALTALHKFYSEDELVNFFLGEISASLYTFYTIGANDRDLAKLKSVRDKILSVNFQSDFPKMICLDAANGYTENFVDHVKKVHSLYPEAILMAGNVVTGNMTEELILSGASIVKVGIGGGSACTTRLVAGVGVPQLTAVDECAYQAHGLSGHICSDGGIKRSGDVCKAIGVGADFVMIGGFFAGTDECDGAWVRNMGGDKTGFKFHGMSSKEAQEKWNGGLSDYRASEGKEVVLPCKGPVEGLLKEIMGGLRSACAYEGAANIKDLPKCALFTRVNRQYNNVFDKFEQGEKK